jgi:predicted  nucleic acid-binding Zn-ribbon protein
MGENKKNSEIKKDFGENLLELAGADEESKGSEMGQSNTSLTLPAFEDKSDQDSWDELVNSPMKTKLSPFLKEVASAEKKIGNDLERSNETARNRGSADGSKNISSVILKPEGIPNASPAKGPPVIVSQSPKEKMPISNVETIAITMLQKANPENNVQQIPQLAPKNLNENRDVLNAKKKDAGLLQSKIPESPLAKQQDGDQNKDRVNEVRLGPIEQIRIAQNRISQLEREVETLRWDNEKIGSAAQLLQKKCGDLANQKQKLEIQFENFESKSAEENKILKSKVDRKREENKELRAKVDELESRLGQGVRRAGGRERELENRLELVNMEKISLVAAKDEIILNLKRQIDHLQFEVESYRKKTSDLQKTIDENDEQIRRTVRALRLALTNLEVSEESKLAKKGE